MWDGWVVIPKVGLVYVIGVRGVYKVGGVRVYTNKE